MASGEEEKTRRRKAKERSECEETRRECEEGKEVEEGETRRDDARAELGKTMKKKRRRVERVNASAERPDRSALE